MTTLSIHSTTFCSLWFWKNDRGWWFSSMTKPIISLELDNSTKTSELCTGLHTFQRGAPQQIQIAYWRGADICMKKRFAWNTAWHLLASMNDRWSCFILFITWSESCFAVIEIKSDSIFEETWCCIDIVFDKIIFSYNFCI